MVFVFHYMYSVYVVHNTFSDVIPFLFLLICLLILYMMTVFQIQQIPLHFACLYGHVTVVELLLDRGSDLRAQDDVSIHCNFVCFTYTLIHNYC